VKEVTCRTDSAAARRSGDARSTTGRCRFPAISGVSDVSGLAEAVECRLRAAALALCARYDTAPGATAGLRLWAQIDWKSYWAWAETW
jgi:hypothetical protein